jgi:hypothetical protein
VPGDADAGVLVCGGTGTFGQSPLQMGDGQPGGDGLKPHAIGEQVQVGAVGFPDLLIAAVAERERVTVLHYDSDFDLTAEVTGQAMQWVVPRGTVT